MNIQTVLIGGAFRDEFDVVIGSVSSQSVSRSFPDLQAFTDWIGAEPDLPVLDMIFILQSYSGQYSQSELGKILNKYPITPIICVLGAWCEGEQRTATPLSGIKSIYVHHWQTEGENEFKRFVAGEFSTFELFPVVSREEIFLETSKRRSIGKFGAGKKAWIYNEKKMIGSDSEMNRLLFEILQSASFSVEYIDWSGVTDEADFPDAIFWDLNEAPLEQVGEIITELRKANTETKIIVLQNAPRVEEKRFLCDAGADLVVAKPFELTSLLMY